MSLQHTCPICGDGVLEQKTEFDEVVYKGSTLVVPLHISVCANCGCEQASVEQSRQNKRGAIAAKKEADGLLSSKQIRAIREYLNLTQADAGNIFGGGPTAFSKYESNDVAQSKSMDTLIRLAYEMPEVAKRLMGGQSDLNIHAADPSSLINNVQASIIDIRSASKRYWVAINLRGVWEPHSFGKLISSTHVNVVKPAAAFVDWASAKEGHTDYAVHEAGNYSSGHDLYVKAENKELH